MQLPHLHPIYYTVTCDYLNIISRVTNTRVSIVRQYDLNPIDQAVEYLKTKGFSLVVVSNKKRDIILSSNFEPLI